MSEKNLDVIPMDCLSELGRFQSDELVNLGESVVKLIKNMPEHSHYRKPLVSALAAYVDDNILSKSLPGTQHTRNEYVRRAKNEYTPEKNPLLNTKYKPGTHRTIHSSQEDHNSLVNFFLSHCRPAHNPYGTTLTRGESNYYLYHIFKYQSHEVIYVLYGIR